jgi:hypothetical protein
MVRPVIVREPLFNGLMRPLDVWPGSKEEGFREFQRRGWILVLRHIQQFRSL